MQCQSSTCASWSTTNSSGVIHSFSESVIMININCQVILCSVLLFNEHSFYCSLSQSIKLFLCLIAYRNKENIIARQYHSIFISLAPRHTVSQVVLSWDTWTEAQFMHDFPLLKLALHLASPNLFFHWNAISFHSAQETLLQWINLHQFPFHFLISVRHTTLALPNFLALYFALFLSFMTQQSEVKLQAVSWSRSHLIWGKKYTMMVKCKTPITSFLSVNLILGKYAEILSLTLMWSRLSPEAGFFSQSKACWNSRHSCNLTRSVPFLRYVLWSPLTKELCALQLCPLNSSLYLHYNNSLLC